MGPSARHNPGVRVHPVPLAAVAVICLGSGPVHGGNGGHMPTPVVFGEAPCLERVERPGGDGLVAIEYAIPLEDVDVTADEPEDSRTHQFFAFSEPFGPEEEPPRWVSWDDVNRAAALGIVSPDELDDEDVLETSTRLQGKWVRITGEAERRPITCEAAEEPVVWDTDGVPDGVYTIWGYTWEPPNHAWRRRPGVVKLVTPEDPSFAEFPAVGVEFTRSDVYDGESATIRACVDAPAGTVLTARWAEAAGAFEPFVSDLPVETGTEDLVFELPPDTDGEFVQYRFLVELEGPDGARALDHRGGLAKFGGMRPPQVCPEGSHPSCPLGSPTDGVCPGGAEPSCVEDVGYCEAREGGGSTGGESGGGSGTETGSGTDTDAETGSDAPGDGPVACSCRQGPPAAASLGWLAIAVGAFRRRTRRRQSGPISSG